MGNLGIVVVVGAVIEDGEGKVLLVKHVPQRGGFWQGKWICPGGRLEWGESIEVGIRREVQEETGLEIRREVQEETGLEIRREVQEETGLEIRREVQEETGLEIRLTRPLVPFDRVVAGELHVIYVDYMAKVTGGQLRPGSDVGEALWMGKVELGRRWGELHEDTQRLLTIAGLSRETKEQP